MAERVVLLCHVALYLFRLMQDFSDPRFVLIDVHNVEDPEGNYWIVENFDPSVHVSRFGGPRSGQTFFCDREEVAHLRDRILN